MSTPLLLAEWDFSSGLLQWSSSSDAANLQTREIRDHSKKQASRGLVSNMRLGFISRSVHARLQVSLCSVYDLFPMVNICTSVQYTYAHKRQHFDQLIWKAHPA